MMQITYDDDMKDILGRTLHVVAPSCKFSCCISDSRLPVSSKSMMAIYGNTLISPMSGDPDAFGRWD